jgi:acyl-CoA thioesterase FadM
MFTMFTTFTRSHNCFRTSLRMDRVLQVRLATPQVSDLSTDTDNRILDPDTPFLQKPFGPEDLQRKVRAVIDLKG